MGLVNNNFSEFTINKVIDIPSLPESVREKIYEGKQADSLDEEPSFATRGTVAMKNVSFGSSKSRIHYGKDGINDIKYTYDLSFNGINELKLLKLIAFFVNKGGSRKFNFTSPKPF